MTDKRITKLRVLTIPTATVNPQRDKMALIECLDAIGRLKAELAVLQHDFGKQVEWLKGWKRLAERLVAKNVRLQKKLDAAEDKISELETQLEEAKGESA
jgi:predicted  nucleic acid-binding Zn-ribbon protein